MARIPLAIAGAAGRMGRELVRAIAASDDLALAGGTERAGASELGQDAGAIAGAGNLGAALTSDVAAAAANAQGWIDFTTPSATIASLEALPAATRFAIIGTTGLDDAAEAKIKAASQRIAIVRDRNFSLGVNLIAALVKQAAAKLGPEWDIEIIEAHHRRKVDAPSGTALMLGEAAADGRGVSLPQMRLAPRDGMPGARPEGGIGFAVVRGGGIVGKHEVQFVAENEIVQISHEAMDRGLFVRGALAAARWAADKPPGFYVMRDVLGF